MNITIAHLQCCFKKHFSMMVNTIFMCHMNLQYHAFLDLIIFLFFMFNADSVLLFRSILQNHNYGSASPLGQLSKVTSKMGKMNK
jgi:hypothetical protein